MDFSKPFDDAFIIKSIVNVTCTVVILIGNNGKINIQFIVKQD